ncbi:hypothetical protein FH972_019912 [Carpinus fangiana]|uniref:Uncharacterized protein n=1 Tax=Carpinus fangiana TaxID=176857 RepID=A0A5N6RRV3_9ROSI|nr:hypothetical protein FH972_019912 [Carpinus fangiana]
MATQSRQAMARNSGHREGSPPKVLGQAGSAPGPGAGGAALCGVVAKDCGEGAMGVSGDVSRGGVGAMGVQGGENPKGRWVQVLLSPAPNSAGVACQTIPGKVTSREEKVYAVGVSEFNAKVELYNCREWLKRIRGEVDAGLQKLNKILREVDFNGPGQGYLGNECVPKPKRAPKPRGKKIFTPKALSVGPGIGPSGCKTFLKPMSLTSSAGGSSGPFNGPQGGLGIGPSGSKNLLKPTSLTTSAGGSSGPLNGPYARDKPTECGLGSPVGRSGHFGGDPSKEEGPIGFVVGRPDSCDLISDGSAARASPLRSGESGSGSSMEKEGSHEVAESIEPMSKEGVTGSVQLKPMQVGKEGSSPAKEGKDLCAKTPVSSRVEQRVFKADDADRRIGCCPASLDFDGGVVESCKSGASRSPVGSLGATQFSGEVVPESRSEVDSAGDSLSGANPVEVEMLNLAMEDGEIMGMTCEGNSGQLKEMLGQIIAENHGRGVGEKNINIKGRGEGGRKFTPMILPELSNLPFLLENARSSPETQ